MARITAIHDRIEQLRDYMSGIVPPWYREQCEETIRRHEAELQTLCVEC